MVDGDSPALVASRPDPRWLRTRAALSRAVVAAASVRPVHEVTLAELAAAAGVSRSTAYEHAGSARELLESVLTAELDGIRDARFTDIAPEHTAWATAAATRDVIAHVERHESVYRIGLAPDAGAGSLQSVLAAQFAGTIRMLLRARELEPDVDVPEGTDPAVVEEIVVRGVAEGAVGQIAAWIAAPAPRDPEVFLAVNARMLPVWWSIAP